MYFLDSEPQNIHYRIPNLFIPNYFLAAMLPSSLTTQTTMNIKSAVKLLLFFLNIQKVNKTALMYHSIDQSYSISSLPAAPQLEHII